MKLIEILNKANKGWKIPMYVYQCYVGSKYVSYVKHAFFQTDSFPVLEQNIFRHYGDPPIQLVEIDYLKESKNGVILYLKIDDISYCHYESKVSLDYNSLIFDKKMRIIGAELWNYSSTTKPKTPFKFEWTKVSK